MTALVDSIEAKEAVFRWKQSRADNMGPPPELAPRLTWQWQSVAAKSLVPWAGLALLVLIWAIGRARTWARRDYLVSAGVFAAAAALRWAVPWVPANWYTDFAAPPGELAMFGKGGFFQVSLLAALLSWGGERYVFAANVLLGSAVPAMLFLAARRLTKSFRAALTFAGLVTVVPFFARLSASDAPHVLILACFSLAVLATATWIHERSWLGVAVAAASILLVAPIRPDTYMGFWALPLLVLWARGSFRNFWKRDRLVVLILGLAAIVGGVPWFLHLVGQEGAGQRFNFPDVGALAMSRLVASRSFGVLTLWIADISEPLMPFVFRLGYAAGVLVLVLRSEKWNVSLLAVSLLVMSLPEIATNFGGSVENLAIGRYMSLTAVVWMIPVAVAIEAGLGWLARAKGPRFVWAGWSCCWLLGMGSSIPGYREISLYGQEYLFLKDALPRDGTMVALWGPSVAGVSDLDCCLALPSLLLARSRPNLRWLVIDPADDKAAEKVGAIKGIEGPVYWYDGTLARMVPKPFDASDLPACEAYLERARDLSSSVRAVGWEGPVQEDEVKMAPNDNLSLFRLREASGIGTVRIWQRAERAHD